MIQQWPLVTAPGLMVTAGLGRIILGLCDSCYVIVLSTYITVSVATIARLVVVTDDLADLVLVDNYM